MASTIALSPLVVAATVLRSIIGIGSGNFIHDISTDLIDPPLFKAATKLRGTNNNPTTITPHNAAIQRKLYPNITSISSPLTVTDSFKRSITIAEQLGWEIHSQDDIHFLIESIDSTKWLGFKDDIIIRVKKADSGSTIDIRSVSRVGRSDLGKNALRIQTFTKAFDTR
jgi:uncharacterized protein (DUF1499 family)